jgi:hypothetical protein
MSRAGVAPASAEYFVWDVKLAGFGLRVQPSGIMTYVAKYQAGSGGVRQRAG